MPYSSQIAFAFILVFPSPVSVGPSLQEELFKGKAEHQPAARRLPAQLVTGAEAWRTRPGANNRLGHYVAGVLGGKPDEFQDAAPMNGEAMS